MDSSILSRTLRVMAVGLAVAVCACSVCAQPAPVSPVMECGQLRRADFSQAVGTAVQITAASVETAGQPAPYCRVQGYISPQIRFEVRLPLSGWSQRYLQTGCGGLCGDLNVRVNNASGCLPAGRGELAMASTDMGHSTGGGGAWAADDPQLRVDFAYRSVHLTALAAKALMEKFYGQRPRYSYFSGCSDGGREALMEAQRFPDDFDGITAGAPAMNFITQNTFYHGWNARVNTGADGRAILTAEKLPILHAAAIAACDELDGVKDGLISDPLKCKFDPKVVECRSGEDFAKCLTPAQAEVAREIYRGAHDAVGQQLVISGPMPGSELAWRGVFVPGGANEPIFSSMIAMDAFKYMAYWNNPPLSFRLSDVKFDQATFDAVRPMHGIYDATDPDLSAYAAHGGKLILWHGWQDPHISPLNTITYYNAVQTLMGADAAQRFARLYLFPGGYHCGGGEGPFEVDLLTPIMAWVENGKAPEKLVASKGADMHGPGGPGGPHPEVSAPSSSPKLTRPVFPYPSVARFSGTGDLNDAASFVRQANKELVFEAPKWLGSSFFTPKYEQWCSWNETALVCQTR
jgi:feruloyl esterase